MNIRKSVLVGQDRGVYHPVLMLDKLISTLNIVNEYLSCEGGQGYVFSYFCVAVRKQHYQNYLW